MTSLTIAQALRDGAEILSAASPSAQTDARFLLCHVIGQNTTYLYTWSDKELSEAHIAEFKAALARRKHGEPVAYINGERGFWSFSLKSTDCTLIPREETECLVEYALEQIGDETAKVLDLGTGTGAIALALAYERPSWQVHACDYNHDAVRLAQENARLVGVDNVSVCQSDWFSAYGEHLNGFDLIVSNPPYIAPDDPHLSQGDLRFEPVGALAAADDGFADIYHIIETAIGYLKPGGRLMIEHGFEQGELICARFIQNGYVDVATHKDLAGLDRFSMGTLA